MENILEFKDLTYHCNITDKEGLRVYKVVGWDSKKGSVDVVHHLDRVTGSLSNFKGIELSNEVLNTLDIEQDAMNCFITFDSIKLECGYECKYLHQLQGIHLFQTNEVLEYKPIV
jgi:hypothetical protein